MYVPNLHIEWSTKWLLSNTKMSVSMIIIIQNARPNMKGLTYPKIFLTKMTDIRPKIHSSLTILEIGSGSNFKWTVTRKWLSWGKLNGHSHWSGQSKTKVKFILYCTLNGSESQPKCTLTLIDKLISSLMRNNPYHNLDIILTFLIFITILILYNGDFGHSEPKWPLFPNTGVN